MSYRITKFGAVLLPDSMTVDDLSTPRTPSTLVDVLGGVFDGYGAAQRIPVHQELVVSGVYHGTAATLRTQVDALRAKQGVRDQLWRTRDDDAALQWRYARLLQVQMRGAVERWAANVAEIDATFETGQGWWRSETATTTTKALAAGATETQAVTAGGNVPVADAIITLTATNQITSFLLTCSAIGVTWDWAGTLAAGKALVIDCGAMTVRNDAANGYSGFGLNTEHTARGWLPLAVGSNTLAMTASAAGSVSIVHYNQWA